MKVSYYLLLVACLLGLHMPNLARANDFWKSVSADQLNLKSPSPLEPTAFRMHQMDEAGFRLMLSRAGTDITESVLVNLPAPSGAMRSFLVWETPIMAAGLAQRYEQIKTYTAVAADDNRISAKLDFTPRGFHAIIFGETGTYFIDPASTQNEGYYLVYLKKDYFRKGTPYMACELNASPVDPSGKVEIDGSVPDLAWKEFGGTKKTYRLALSCTGEYAVAVAGSNPTKLNVLSAMVTTINRVNGIYEKELSVSLELIGDNDTLIYLNGSTDPFDANNNGGALLGQNQTNTNTVIGAANYDIGHIFSTGGGGIAFLGCVCANNQKARGVTGSPSPVGDPFDVDYVAHEMGHQFGANHSFNACSGTESQQNAFEPGSGSTIMAYAGICGPVNNLQANSHDYFHITSLDEISDFIVNGSWGGAGGSSCGTSETGISAPIMDNQNISYQIPARTPFMLTAPEASSPDSATITYGWEQWNLGNFQEAESGAANFSAGPSFRSYESTPSRIRVFPKMDSILNNNTSFIGERLSNVDRQLRFRAVARKVSNGFGAFNFTNSFTTVNVTNTGVPFSVSFPNNTQDTLPRNGTATITWEVAQTNLPPINAAQVTILLSTDGGQTYPISLADSVPNTGSAQVNIPNIFSSTARVMIKATHSVFFDISNRNIVIAEQFSSLADIALEKQLNIFPNPATDYIIINYAGTAKADVILYSALGQVLWQGQTQRSVQVPVSGYARGQYFLEVTDSRTGGKAIKKISLR